VFQSLTPHIGADRAETWYIQCRISVTRYALDIDQGEDGDWSFPSYRQAQGNGMSCAARGIKARKQTRYSGPEGGGGVISYRTHPILHIRIQAFQDGSKGFLLSLYRRELYSGPRYLRKKENR
jgi:hypothetical protein